MRKTVLIVLLFMLFFVSGCASESSKENLKDYDDYSDVDTDPTPPAPQQEEIILEGGEVLQTSSTPALLNRKIIYTADLGMTSFTPLELYNDVIGLLDDYTAYVEAESLTDDTYVAKIRVLSTELDDLLMEMKQDSEVVDFTRSSEDITNAYSTFEARKLALETQQTRIIELIAVAEDLSDMLILEEKRAEIESELNQIGDALANFDSLVDYSTINLTITLKTEEEVILPLTVAPYSSVINVDKKSAIVSVTNKDEEPAKLYVDLYKNGEFVKQYEKDAYPDSVTEFSIGGLTSDTRYSLKITAISAEQRESNKVTQTFTTESTFINDVGNVFGASLDMLLSVLSFFGLAIVALLPFGIAITLIIIPSRILYMKYGKSYVSKRREAKKKLMDQQLENRIKREEEINFKRVQYQKYLMEQNKTNQNKKA